MGRRPEAYSSGTEGLENGVAAVLSGIPLAGSTGLGEWGRQWPSRRARGGGLEPADTAPSSQFLPVRKPWRALAGGDWSAGTSLCASRPLARPEASSDALGLLAERVSDEAYQRLASLEITLAVVEIPLTGVSVPLTVTLPATLAEGATGLVDGAFAALRNIVGAPTYLERWE